MKDILYFSFIQSLFNMENFKIIEKMLDQKNTKKLE